MEDDCDCYFEGCLGSSSSMHCPRHLRDRCERSSSDPVVIVAAAAGDKRPQALDLMWVAVAWRTPDWGRVLVAPAAI